jgi:UDP-N-acetylmuramate dehydrogenase
MNSELPAIIQPHQPLKNYTSWGIGGMARWLAEPTAAQLPDLIHWAQGQAIPIYCLGRGSNVLIDDGGVQGLVILTRNSMTHLALQDGYIVAGGGTFLPRLARFAASQGFAGFEFLMGIPGTVGGAIAMNAGLTVFRPREMTAIVKDFEMLTWDGTLQTLTMADVDAGYRHTNLLNGQGLVLRARFNLDHPADPSRIKRDTLAHLAERKRKQPLDKLTAGSTFKSPPGSQGAGWYIEQAGLKGLQIGGARVSPVHANWIENLGHASSQDVRELIEHIQTRVKEEMGIKLQPEVRFWP